MLQHVTLEIPRDRAEACVAFWALLGFAPMVAPPVVAIPTNGGTTSE